LGDRLVRGTGKGGKVLKRDLVFERLMNGDSLGDVRREFKGGSSVYKGLKLFFERSEGRVLEYHTKIKSLDGELKAKKATNKKISEELRVANKTVEELDKQVKVKKNEISSLNEKYSEVWNTYETLTSKLDSLRKKGVNEPAIARIGKLDFGSGDELLGRLSTHEKHMELQSEIKGLGLQIEEMTSRLKLDDTILENLKVDIASENNALDEVRRRRLLHDEANKVIQGYLQDGYDPELLLSLLEVLGGLAIKDQPKLSLERLVQGLKEYRELSLLKADLQDTQNEFDEISLKLAEAEASLVIIKKIILKEIEEAKNESIKMLLEQHSDAADLYSELKKQVETDLETLMNNHAAGLTILKEDALANLIAVNNKAVDTMDTAGNNFRDAMVGYESTIRDWGNEKKLEGKFKEIFRYAEIIYDIHESPKDVREIPPHIMERFVYTAANWAHAMVPDAMRKPDSGTRRLDRNFYEYTDYKILALLDMASKFFAELSDAYTRKNT